MVIFTSGQLESLAKAFVKTDDSLTVPEIDRLFRGCRIEDINSRDREQWKRLFKSFKMHLSKGNDSSGIIEFIEDAMDPSRYVDTPLRYKTIRQNLNKILKFANLKIDNTGRVILIKPAQILSDTKDPAITLYKGLDLDGIHLDVLKFCSSELEANNYFYAALEATKSIAYKLRDLTGLSGDGDQLVGCALGAKPSNTPMVTINAFKTESDQSEQRGFLYLVKGIFSMFRNPTAHDARIQSKIDKDDLKAVLSLASMIHRRLDEANITPPHTTE